MGCGASRDNLSDLEKPLNWVMWWTHIYSVDSVFSPISDVIYDLEKVRSTLVDGQDSLIELSGAAAYKETSLGKILLCLMQKTAADFDGDLSKAGLEVTYYRPYIRIANSNSADSLQNTVSQLADYVSNMMELEERIRNIVERLTDLGSSIPEKTNQMIEDVKNGTSTNPLESMRYVAYIHKNASRTATATKRAAEISVFIAQQVVQLKDFATIFSDSKRISEINEVGKKAKEKKITDAIAIAWEFAPPAERLGTTYKLCLELLKGKKGMKTKLKEEITKEQTQNKKSDSDANKQKTASDNNNNDHKKDKAEVTPGKTDDKKENDPAHEKKVKDPATEKKEEDNQQRHNEKRDERNDDSKHEIKQKEENHVEDNN